MANEGIRTIFGVAVTAANVRAFNLGYSADQNNLCTAFGIAFDVGGAAGSIFTHIKNNTSLNLTDGFDGTSHYRLYEDDVYAVIEASFGSESLHNKQILALAAHAVIFGYALNSNIPLKVLSYILGNVLSNVADIVNGKQLFSNTHGVVEHPFTIEIITRQLRHDYSLVVNEINGSPKDKEVSLSNYNWYDVNSLFTSPDLQLMKDIENQYYYISGQLLYQTSFASLPECIEDNILINGPEGPKASTFIRNTPCIQANSYVGPVSGVQFYRVFNDGPSTSGNFTSTIRDEYIAFDKRVLSGNDYLANGVRLLSFQTGSDGQFSAVYDGYVFEDDNGQYGLLSSEYVSLPSHCSLAKMHIGGTGYKVNCTGEVNCLGCTTGSFTGFKYVSMELNPRIHANDFLAIQTNPVIDTGRVLKRALSISSNPYLATNVGDELQTYFLDSFNNATWYVGPPQLNGISQLPSLAFYQTFDSQTFGDTAKVVIFPAISNAAGTSVDDSIRSFSVSPIPLASGVDTSHHPLDSSTQAKATFLRIVGSDQQDEVYQQFFGMGDNFGNQYSDFIYQQENAGFFYTGFVLSGSSGAINANTIVDSYSGYILGSPVEHVRYISGYQLGSQFIEMNRLYAQDYTGNLKLYYYFDQRNMPGDVTIHGTGMSYFAVPPTDLEDNYTRVLTTQKVENYFPRFSKGPFAVETERFLYPNAATVSQMYVGKLNGFPKRIKFHLELREESVKELFATYKISKDGIVDNTPNYIRIIRPSDSGIINFTAVTPYMTQMFYPNEPQYNFTYDFNGFAIGNDFSLAGGLEGVDNNWAPLVNGFVSSGRNNITYNGSQDISEIFTQGIRMTGNGPQTHKIYTGTGVNQFYTSNSEQPLNVGLYHAYKTFAQDTELYYTLPIWNIGQGTKIVTDEMTGAFRQVADNVGFLVEGYNDLHFVLDTGIDPLFFEPIGGRRLGFNTSGEGGYHSHGLIGDRWFGTVAADYGAISLHDTACHRGDAIRYPVADDRILLFNTCQTGTTLWTRSLAFSPFEFDRVYQPFSTSQTLNWAIDGRAGTLITNITGHTLHFPIDYLMPLKSGVYGESYSSGGLVIGPFDREVEIGVTNGNRIIAYTDLYANGNKVSQYYNPDSCAYDPLKGTAPGSGVIPGEYRRAEGFTVMTVVPSGGYLNLNIVSSPISGGFGQISPGHPAETMVGFESGAIISVRNRRLLDGSVYHDELHSGERSWVSPFYFVENGLEKAFNISHSRLETLAGTHEFVTFTQSGKIYPKPGDDFTGLATKDRFGNLIYPSSATVEQYWKNYARTNRQSVTVTGWREGSRVSFAIKGVSLVYDDIPYQDYRLVIPTGTCTISGEMGYLTQADQGIFSEGLRLVNHTENDLLSGLYNPQFMSNVIKRLPWVVIPSGTTASPIYEAPSVMKQRATLAITGNQIYSGLLSDPPDNYNKLNWPALSDLETLNEGETIEAIPPDDGNTFTNSTMLFSAAQGQTLPNGKRNPNIRKTYDVVEQYQMYDSIATDALINSGHCITSLRGTKVRLTPDLLESSVSAAGTPLSLVNQGLE